MRPVVLLRPGAGWPWRVVRWGAVVIPAVVAGAGFWRNSWPWFYPMVAVVLVVTLVPVPTFRRWTARSAGRALAWLGLVLVLAGLFMLEHYRADAMLAGAYLAVPGVMLWLFVPPPGGA